MAESLQFRRDGNCLWVVPRTSHVDLNATPELSALNSEIDQHGITRLIVDLSQLPYFGSTVLELLVHLWRRVGQAAGRLVLHNPSPIGRDVLTAARLDQLWPVADTEAEALRLVQSDNTAQ